MAPENSDNYLSVDIDHFRNSSRDITFDVYIRISDGNYAHVFSKKTGLDYQRLAQYFRKGVRKLYIRETDQEAFNSFMARPVQRILDDPEVPQERKVATLINMTEQNMAEVFAQIDVPEDTARYTKKVVGKYVDMMANDPNTLAVMLKLVSHGQYLYYHSISTAIFSLFIARASGQFNRRTLEIVGLGGFLHDIGSTQLPEDVTDSPDELTPSEWKLMRSHPKIGLKMLENTKGIPDEVRYIIYQHHEEPGGNGYPNGLKNPVIYYPAKIVALADSFSALISNRPFRPAYTVEQAIHVLQSQPGKYDKDLLRILSSIFIKRPSQAA